MCNSIDARDTHAALGSVWLAHIRFGRMQMLSILFLIQYDANNREIVCNANVSISRQSIG